MQVINLKLESNMKEEMLEDIYGTVESEVKYPN